MSTDSEMRPSEVVEEAGMLPEVEAAAGYEPNAILAELRGKMAEGRPPTSLPERLPLGDVKVAEELFQPRGMVEKHISDLVRALRIAGELDAVLVIQTGPEAYLVNGHHRLAAYQEARRETIPVVYFEGTLEDAVLEAGRVNSKANLPMQNRERQEYAWQLVLMEGYSKSQIVKAAGVADGQVGNMRRAKETLGDRAYSARSWYEARSWAQGLEVDPMTDEARDAWVEQTAHEWSDRLFKEFGTKLSNHREIAGRTLELYFGRRLPDLLDYMGYEPREETDWC